MVAGLTEYAADVLSKSGGIGLVTALVLFVCFGIGLERLLFWRDLWGFRAMLGLGGLGALEKRTNRVAALVRSRRYADAARQARRAPQAAVRLMGLALGELRGPDGWAATRDRVLIRTLGGNVTLGRRFLMTAIQGFGLLGMLGTCKGLYAQLSSFSSVAAEPAALQTAMGGMGEAFTTTLVGLAAAGLTMLIYLPNEIAIERFQRELRLVDSQIRAAFPESERSGQDGRGESPRKV